MLPTLSPGACGHPARLLIPISSHKCSVGGAEEGAARGGGLAVSRELARFCDDVISFDDDVMTLLCQIE